MMSPENTLLRMETAVWRCLCSVLNIRVYFSGVIARFVLHSTQWTVPLNWQIWWTFSSVSFYLLQKHSASEASPASIISLKYDRSVRFIKWASLPLQSVEMKFERKHYPVTSISQKFDANLLYCISAIYFFLFSWIHITRFKLHYL